MNYYKIVSFTIGREGVKEKKTEGFFNYLDLALLKAEELSDKDKRVYQVISIAKNRPIKTFYKE